MSSHIYKFRCVSCAEKLRMDSDRESDKSTDTKGNLMRIQFRCVNCGKELTKQKCFWMEKKIKR